MNALERHAQVAWEIEGHTRAAARYREAAAHADPGELPGTQKMLREVVPPLAAFIAEQQDVAAEKLGKSHSGRPPNWGWAIQTIEAEKLAVITVVSVLSAQARQGDDEYLFDSVTQASRSIATAMRRQIEYDRWVEQNSGGEGRDILAAFRKRYPSVNKRIWDRWRRRVEVERVDPWPQEVSVAIGAHLIGLLCLAAPGRFSVAARRLSGVKSGKFIELSPETKELLFDIESRAEVARPLLMPMIVPPIPWSYDE